MTSPVRNQVRLTRKGKPHEKKLIIGIKHEIIGIDNVSKTCEFAFSKLTNLPMNQSKWRLIISHKDLTQTF